MKSWPQHQNVWNASNSASILGKLLNEKDIINYIINHVWVLVYRNVGETLCKISFTLRHSCAQQRPIRNQCRNTSWSTSILCKPSSKLILTRRNHWDISHDADKQADGFSALFNILTRVTAPSCRSRWMLRHWSMHTWHNLQWTIQEI